MKKMIAAITLLFSIALTSCSFITYRMGAFLHVSYQEIVNAKVVGSHNSFVVPSDILTEYVQRILNVTFKRGNRYKGGGAYLVYLYSLEHTYTLNTCFVRIDERTGLGITSIDGPNGTIDSVTDEFFQLQHNSL